MLTMMADSLGAWEHLGFDATVTTYQVITGNYRTFHVPVPDLVRYLNVFGVQVSTCSLVELSAGVTAQLLTY